MNQFDYDRILYRLAKEMTVDSILAIPGVKGLVAQELHNDILREFEKEEEEE